MSSKTTEQLRVIRHRRLRKRTTGTPERPRLCVYRSLRHIYAQVVDDVGGVTIAAAGSLELKHAAGGATAGASMVGEAIAKKAIEKGVKQVVFDRGGYRYHGRVAALAQAAREKGLEF